ncbi:MAG TPA: cytochrome c family protein [Roseomonas sp.]
MASTDKGKDALATNKVFAAVLTAGVVFGLAGFVSKLLVHPHQLHEAAIEVGEPPAAGAAAPAEAPLDPVTPLLAAANPQTGQQLVQRYCSSCHTFNEGGPARVGPNLYGIVGNHHAHAEGFSYSPGMRAKVGDQWTYEALNVFLHRPASGVPGTRMGFAGIASASQRADVIAYLRSISPNAPAP